MYRKGAVVRYTSMPANLCVLIILTAACGTRGYDLSADSDGQTASLDATLSRDAPGPCDGESVIFCESFESDLAAWEVLQGGGALSIEVADGRSGRGLHVETPVNGTTVLRRAIPELQTVYARAWIRLPSGDDFGAYAVLMELNQSLGSGEKISLDGVASNNLQIVFIGNVETNARGGDNTVPRSEWFCAELFVEFGNPGVAWAQIGDTRVELVSGQNLTATEGYFDVFQVGLSSRNRSLQASIDDVFVSENYIPCNQ